MNNAVLYSYKYIELVCNLSATVVTWFHYNISWEKWGQSLESEVDAASCGCTKESLQKQQESLGEIQPPLWHSLSRFWWLGPFEGWWIWVPAIKDGNGRSMLLLGILQGLEYKLGTFHRFSLAIFDNCQRESRLPLLQPDFANLWPWWSLSKSSSWLCRQILFSCFFLYYAFPIFFSHIRIDILVMQQKSHFDL